MINFPHEKQAPGVVYLPDIKHTVDLFRFTVTVTEKAGNPTWRVLISESSGRKSYSCQGVFDEINFIMIGMSVLV